MDYEPDLYSVATKIAVDALSRRARSRGELAQLLSRRAMPEEVAERLLDRLAAQKLLDDRAFAQEWAQLRHRSKGLSRRALAQELRKRAIAPDLIDEALSAIAREDEVLAVRALIAKKLPSLIRVDDEIRYRRLHSFLARKGYSSSIISEAIPQELGLVVI